MYELAHVCEQNLTLVCIILINCCTLCGCSVDRFGCHAINTLNLKPQIGSCAVPTSSRSANVPLTWGMPIHAGPPLRTRTPTTTAVWSTHYPTPRTMYALQCARVCALIWGTHYPVPRTMPALQCACVCDASNLSAGSQQPQPKHASNIDSVIKGF